MMNNYLRGQAVLITGGTTGIGLATALTFARRGAVCTLTYDQEGLHDDTVSELFAREELPMPYLVQANVSKDDDASTLLNEMRSRHETVYAFISSDSTTVSTTGFDTYDKKALFRNIENKAWPMFSYTMAIRKTFGRYPRYVVALSNGAPDHFYRNHDFIGASNALMETLCRYMNYRLYDDNVRINVVRSRFVLESKTALGEDFVEFASRLNLNRQFVSADEVAGAIFGLCSGFMDSVSGQVITVDRGGTFSDNLMGLWEEQKFLNLSPEGLK